jgi:hypothetical protein
VHDQLETLSQVLGAQIESMSLAVDVSGKSYASLDDDIKAKMHRLNSQVQSHYDPSRDPYAKHPKHATGPASEGGYGSSGAQGSDGS